MDQVKRCQYLADVKLLNENLKNYVLESLGQSEYIDFTPTFNDYISQIKNLDDKHNSVYSSQSNLTKPLFSQPAPLSSSFSQSVFSQSMFSQSGSASQPIFTPPTFAQSATPSQPNATIGDTEDTEDTPPEPNVDKFVESGHKLELRCKLYQRVRTTRNEMETKLIGVGMLYVKPIDDGKLQIIFRQDPDLRKVAMNEIITKSSVVSNQPKAVKMAFPDPAAGQPKMFIAKVASENESNKLYDCVTFKDQTN